MAVPSETVKINNILVEEDTILLCPTGRIKSMANVGIFSEKKCLVKLHGDTSVLEEGLSQTLDGMSSTFETVLSSLKLAVPDAESVIVEYLDVDGNLIVSKEFK